MRYDADHKQKTRERVVAEAAKAIRREGAHGISVARLRETLADALRVLGDPRPAENGASLLAKLVGALAVARAEPDRERSDAILAASTALLKRRFGLEPHP